MTSDELFDTSNIDPAVLQSSFVQTPALQPLRVTCYGSSSSDTPHAYLLEARSLGYILAKRGHTCVNGAGSYGCMAAMNDGCAIGDGAIVGVIHEMWLKESDTLRDGGAHPVFQSTENASAAKEESGSSNGSTDTQKHGGPHRVFNGTKRQMLVAGGKDLQERKRLLVDNADALVVLPGGPGTWDELWEMACAKGIGLSRLPIVCVSVNGYYEPFHRMLQRAYDDQLTKLQPHEIVHFVETATEAVEWVEAVHSGTVVAGVPKKPSFKAAALRKSSFLHTPVVGGSSFSFTDSIRRSMSRLSEWNGDENTSNAWAFAPILTFVAGAALGAAIVANRRR